MIFVSYSWRDKFIAKEIVNKCLFNGLSVWIDYINLDIRLPLKEQIECALIESVFVLVVRSPASYGSKWVRFEVNKAVQLNKKLVFIQASPNRKFNNWLQSTVQPSKLNCELGSRTKSVDLSIPSITESMPPNFF